MPDTDTVVSDKAAAAKQFLSTAQDAAITEEADAVAPSSSTTVKKDPYADSNIDFISSTDTVNIANASLSSGKTEVTLTTPTHLITIRIAKQKYDDNNKPLQRTLYTMFAPIDEPRNLSL